MVMRFDNQVISMRFDRQAMNLSSMSPMVDYCCYWMVRVKKEANGRMLLTMPKNSYSRNRMGSIETVVVNVYCL